MIQAANIGVGIRGKEGLQAARAADYQVCNFRSLQQLLLVHGHYSYARTCLVAQYSFYKSFCFCSMQIAYGFFSYFSGSSLFNSLCITGYNALLFFPIVTFILDKDVPYDIVMSHPLLYRHGAKSNHFNVTSLMKWAVRAFYHALIIFTLTVQTRGVDNLLAGKGFPSEYECIGLVAFCAYLWIQSTTMLMELHNIAFFNMTFVWFFHVLCFALLFATNLLFSFQSLNPYYSVSQTFFDLQFWLISLVTLFAAIVPVIFVQAWAFNYYPSLSDILRFARIALGRGGRSGSATQETSKAALIDDETQEKKSNDVR